MELKDARTQIDIMDLLEERESVHWANKESIEAALTRMAELARAEALDEAANSLEYGIVDYDVNVAEARKFSSMAKDRVRFYVAVTEANAEAVRALKQKTGGA